MRSKREEIECACIASEMASILADAPLYAWSESSGNTADFNVRRQGQGRHFTETAELVDKGGGGTPLHGSPWPTKRSECFHTLRPSCSTLNPSGCQARLIYEWRIGIRADD